MKKLGGQDRFIFSCCFSAYQYRSKFVHQGFPFSDNVKEWLDSDKETGMAYLSPTVGESFMKIYRPEGLQEGDTIDVHSAIHPVGRGTQKKFRDEYFLLIPKWHFIKRIAQAGLRCEISKL